MADIINDTVLLKQFTYSFKLISIHFKGTRDNFYCYSYFYGFYKSSNAKIIWFNVRKCHIL